MSPKGFKLRCRPTARWLPYVGVPALGCASLALESVNQHEAGAKMRGHPVVRDRALPIESQDKLIILKMGLIPPPHVRGLGLLRCRGVIRTPKKFSPYTPRSAL
jgi:hypothetical protein